jgi:GT2 family glycosyltransferase
MLNGESNKWPHVKILVLNYNGMVYLKNLMKTLIRTDYPDYEVVVIDNCSTDNSVEYLKTNYPEIQVVENDRNYGFAGGYNRTCDKVANECEFFVLLNNDVLVEPSWLRELVTPAFSDSRIAATTPKVYFLDKDSVLNACGGVVDVYGFGFNRGNGEKDEGQYDKEEECFYAVGVAMLIRSKCWKEIGPFDVDYFAYHEDLDWSWRARLSGYRIIYCPKSIIYHKWRGSFKKNTEPIYLVERNRLTTCLKNYEDRDLVLFLPRYFLLQSLKTLYFLLLGKRSFAKIFLKALVSNALELKKTISKRQLIQKLRKVPSSYIREHMSKRSFELLLGMRAIKHPVTDRLLKDIS